MQLNHLLNQQTHAVPAWVLMFCTHKHVNHPHTHTHTHCYKHTQKYMGCIVLLLYIVEANLVIIIFIYIYLYIYKKSKLEMKWNTCTGQIQACIYMMRPEIIISTFQMVDDALLPLPLPPRPRQLPCTPDYTHWENWYILIQTTQCPTVVLWSASTVTDFATCTVE